MAADEDLGPILGDVDRQNISRKNDENILTLWLFYIYQYYEKYMEVIKIPMKVIFREFQKFEKVPNNPPPMTVPSALSWYHVPAMEQIRGYFSENKFIFFELEKTRQNVQKSAKCILGKASRRFDAVRYRFVASGID